MILQNVLPSTSGISMLSAYVISSLLFISSAKLEYSILLMVSRVGEEAKNGKLTKYFNQNRGRIDVIALVVYILGFAIFNLTYFSYAFITL